MIYQSITSFVLQIMLIAGAFAQDGGAAVEVVAQPAVIGTISRIYSTVGQTTPARQVQAASQFGGRIVELMAGVGEKVRRNQPLARLRSKQAERQSPQITAESSGHLIVADIDGIVVQQFKSFGDIVSPGSPVFRIISDTEYRLRIDVPLQYATYISYSTTVRYKQNGETVTALPVRLLPAQSQVPGMFSFEVRASKDTKIPGEFINVKVVLEKHKESIIVPRSALVRVDQTFFVFVVESGKALKIVVQPGIENRQNVEILSGLTSGDQVIVKGNYNLVSGVNVKVKPGA